MVTTPQDRVRVLAALEDPREMVEGKECAKRAALYVRTSTEDGAGDAYSVAYQLNRLRTYARSVGYEIAGEYVDDGYTGRNENRPAYRRMMDELDRWDVLLVLKVDRIHRNVRNFLRMTDNLKRWGKDFDSQQEQLDTTTAMGQFVMSIIQAIAELESKMIGEWTTSGLEQAFRQGKRNLGYRAPYGYRWSVGDPKHGTGELLVHEEEAPIVRRIYELATTPPPLSKETLRKYRREGRSTKARKGAGVGAISDLLGWCACRPTESKRKYRRRDGTVVAKSYTLKKHNCTGCNRVRYILRNPFYIGFQVYQGRLHPHHFPTLIDRPTFEAVDRRRYKWQTDLPTK